MSKNIKILLTLSILANILLAGAFFGMVMEKHDDMPWEKVKEGLSPASQEMVAKVFQETWKDMGSVMRQSMDNRKYLAEVIRADEFDPGKFDEAVGRIKGVQDLMAKKKLQATRELLMKLPPDDRKKLADQVANSFSWKGGHPGKRHDYPPSPHNGNDKGPPPKN